MLELMSGIVFLVWFVTLCLARRLDFGIGGSLLIALVAGGLMAGQLAALALIMGWTQ